MAGAPRPVPKSVKETNARRQKEKQKPKKSGPGVNDRVGNDPRRGSGTRGGQDPNPKMSAQQKQAMLAKMGYAIDVDGIWGPQSEMAWKAYTRKIPASYWNRNAPRSNEYVAKPKGGKGGGKGAAPAGPGGGGKAAGGGTGGGTGGMSPIDVRTSPIHMGNFDPEKYATSLTDLAYSGPIAELRRQRSLEMEQGKMAANDIRNWFNQVISTADAGRAENAAQVQAGLSNYDAAAKGLAAAFGGGANIAAGEMGSAALTGRADLQQLGQVQSAFDNRMRSILPLQRTDALLREARSREQRVYELGQKLSGLLGERGTALQKNRLDAQNVLLQRQSQLLQNRATEQNMQLAAQLLPAQLREAQLRNQGLAAANKQAKLDYDTTMAQFEAWQEQRGSKGGGWDLDPGERSKLADRLYQSVVGADGIPRMNPNKAFGVIGNLLAAANLKGPEATTFRQQVMKWIFPGIKFGPKGNPVASRIYTK